MEVRGEVVGATGEVIDIHDKVAVRALFGGVSRARASRRRCWLVAEL